MSTFDPNNYLMQLNPAGYEHYKLLDVNYFQEACGLIPSIFANSVEKLLIDYYTMENFKRKILNEATPEITRYVKISSETFKSANSGTVRNIIEDNNQFNIFWLISYINNEYSYGGGIINNKGLIVDNIYQYPGDPDLYPFARLTNIITQYSILIYPCGCVGIFDQYNNYVTTRMD